MIVADSLADLHFTAQAEASTDLEVLDIVRLDPFVRGLLFTDGTVTRALEAQTLAPVTVEAIEQQQMPAPERTARYLQVSAGEQCIRRRVAMTIEGTPLSVWAESYVVTDRLPEDFLGALGGSPSGIGGSLQRLRLESVRELLWFGLGAPPQWAGVPASVQTALIRFYRIITAGMPALLISEAFAVEARAGVYHLIGAADPVSAARERARSRDEQSRIIRG